LMASSSSRCPTQSRWNHVKSFFKSRATRIGYLRGHIRCSLPRFRFG